MTCAPWVRPNKTVDVCGKATVFMLQVCVSLQVTLEWDQVESHTDVPVTGYMVRVDDQQLGEVLSISTRKTTIDNLQPGKPGHMESKVTIIITIKDYE